MYGKLFFFNWNPFIFVGYGNDLGFFHANPYILNVTQMPMFADAHISSLGTCGETGYWKQPLWLACYNFDIRYFLADIWRSPYKIVQRSQVLATMKFFLKIAL